MILDMQQITISVEETKLVEEFFLQITAGEFVALDGASGSGKSILAHSIMGIAPKNVICHGNIKYCGEPLTDEKRTKILGKEIVLVPQNISYLDPLMKVGRQVAKGKKDKVSMEKVKKLFQKYHMQSSVMQRYPHMISGGMARRVFISSALMEQPKLVIADEPTPGLHKKMAEMVVSHFREMAEMGAGVLMITHDLELAIACADKIIVLYAGKIMEQTKAKNFQSEDTLYHPYTKALWRAMPKNGFHNTTMIQPSETGCPFFEGCTQSKKECKQNKIPYFQKEDSIIKCICAGGTEICY